MDSKDGNMNSKKSSRGRLLKQSAALAVGRPESGVGRKRGLMEMPANLKLSKGAFVCALGVWLLISTMGAIRLQAQAATATLLGTVKDSSGAVMPGVKLDVKNVGTGVAQSVATDAQGRYRVANLPVGGYELQAAMAGFQTAVRTGITLTVGSQSIVDFQLQFGQQQQVVTVAGEISEVQTTNSAVATLTEQKQMKELPLNGRNFEQLILLAPGVQQITNFS